MRIVNKTKVSAHETCIADESMPEMTPVFASGGRIRKASCHKLGGEYSGLTLSDAEEGSQAFYGAVGRLECEEGTFQQAELYALGDGEIIPFSKVPAGAAVTLVGIAETDAILRLFGFPSRVLKPKAEKKSSKPSTKATDKS